MKYTNRFKLPKSLCDAIKKNTYDLSQSDQRVISVTTLFNPPRIRQLSIRHWDNLEEDVSDNIWRLLGSAVHVVLSRIKDTNRLIEERMFVDMNTGKVITLPKKEYLKPEKGHIYLAGKPDVYEHKDEAVEDFKITSVWAVKFEKIEWEQQLNCYSWFFRKLGFPVKKAYISAILRDWRRREAQKYKDYPKIPYKKLPIKLWSFEKQEEYIQKRIKLHQGCVNLADNHLPLCTKAERWKDDIRCKGYCSCNQFCNYYLKNYGDKK